MRNKQRMSDEATKIESNEDVNQVPAVSDVAVPMWTMGLLIVLVWLGMLFLDCRVGGFDAEVYRPYPSLAFVENLSVTDPPPIARGRVLYNVNCAGCHQSSGAGVSGQFPPLRGSDWVTAPKPDRLVRIAMNGLKGPVHINGEIFNESGAAVMLSVGSDNKFTAEQMADLLSYIRASKDIGNAAPMVAPGEIAESMDAAASRGKTPWTEAELLEIPVE